MQSRCSLPCQPGHWAGIHCPSACPPPPPPAHHPAQQPSSSWRTVDSSSQTYLSPGVLCCTCSPPGSQVLYRGGPWPHWEASPAPPGLALCTSAAGTWSPGHREVREGAAVTHIGGKGDAVTHIGGKGTAVSHIWGRGPAVSHIAGKGAA